MKSKLVISLFAGVLLFSMNHALAQELPKDAPYKRWLLTGRGFGYPQLQSSTFSYHLRTPTNAYLQVALNTTATYQGAFTLNRNIPASASLSISRGMVTYYKHSHRAIFVGPSVIGIQKEYYGESFPAFGVVGNIQYVFKPVEGFGIGVDVYGNLNKVQPVGSVRLILTLISKQ